MLSQVKLLIIILHSTYVLLININMELLLSMNYVYLSLPISLDSSTYIIKLNMDGFTYAMYTILNKLRYLIILLCIKMDKSIFILNMEHYII